MNRRLRGTTCQKTVIFIQAAVRTWNTTRKRFIFYVNINDTENIAFVFSGFLICRFICVVVHETHETFAPHIYRARLDDYIGLSDPTEKVTPPLYLKDERRSILRNVVFFKKKFKFQLTI